MRGDQLKKDQSAGDESLDLEVYCVNGNSPFAVTNRSLSHYSQQGYLYIASHYTVYVW